MATAQFYVVYINRLTTVSYDAVKEKMNLSRSWYRITEQNWILYTTSDAAKWYARLSPFVKDKGSLFICKLDTSDRQGWINKSFWEWIKEHSES